MKIKILFSLMIVSASYSKAQTSTYHQFPDSSAVWNVKAYEPCGFFFNITESSYSIFMDGDTVLNGFTYHRLSIPIIESNAQSGCPQSGSWTSPGYTIGYMREDTSLKKVFFKRTLSTPAELLYDFNMEVGDTLQGYLAHPTEIDVVQSIDSVLVGSGYRKRWNINIPYQINFIEGIGSIGGLVQRSPGNITDQSNYLTTCFTQDNTLLYTAGNFNCNLIDDVTNDINDQENFSIHPNPFNEIAILTHNLSDENLKGSIYNSVGKLIRENMDIKDKSFQIMRESLIPGIYFLKLESGGNVYRNIRLFIF
jgi:Secretion system C-terminal sorting domain